eukprot:scaffold7811_cov92-Cylindrotheca_fusiformis.AAC.5
MPSGCGSRFMEIAACFTISRFSRRGYLLYRRPATMVRFLSLIVWMARSTSGTCSSGAQRLKLIVCVHGNHAKTASFVNCTNLHRFWKHMLVFHRSMSERMDSVQPDVPGHGNQKW